jgi:hypothetical protein
MAVRAEVTTGTRRLIDYVLSPGNGAYEGKREGEVKTSIGSCLDEAGRKIDMTIAATKFVLVTVASMLVVGCAGRVNKSWSEEVQVDEKTIIIVDRQVKYQVSRSWSGDAYSQTELASRLEFRGAYSKLPPWNDVLLPLVLYRDVGSGEWTLVASTFSCEIAWQRGNPRNLYWEFRIRDGVWKQIALQPSSFRRASNLFFRYDEDLPASHLSLRMKEDARTGIKIHKPYLTVDESYNGPCD